MSDPSRWKDLFGNQGLPQDCFETCGKPDCLMEGCARLKREEAERKERLLREARAS